MTVYRQLVDKYSDLRLEHDEQPRARIHVNCGCCGKSWKQEAAIVKPNGNVVSVHNCGTDNTHIRKIVGKIYSRTDCYGHPQCEGACIQELSCSYFPYPKPKIDVNYRLKYTDDISVSTNKAVSLTQKKKKLKKNKRKIKEAKKIHQKQQNDNYNLQTNNNESSSAFMSNLPSLQNAILAKLQNKHKENEDLEMDHQAVQQLKQQSQEHAAANFRQNHNIDEFKQYDNTKLKLSHDSHKKKKKNANANKNTRNDNNNSTNNTNNNSNNQKIKSIMPLECVIQHYIHNFAAMEQEFQFGQIASTFSIEEYWLGISDFMVNLLLLFCFHFIASFNKIQQSTVGQWCNYIIRKAQFAQWGEVNFKIQQYRNKQQVLSNAQNHDCEMFYLFRILELIVILKCDGPLSASIAFKNFNRVYGEACPWPSVVSLMSLLFVNINVHRGIN